MPEPENEATLQATANLSPISPSPVYSTATLVVPALQQTVDSIDAMVAAAAAATTSAAATVLNGVVIDIPSGDHNNLAPVDEAMEDIVDDDSFNDPYGDEADEAPAAEPSQQETIDNDDYAKTFDSPIGPEEGEDIEDHHVSSASSSSSIPRESNTVSLPSDHLNSHSSDVPHVASDSSATVPAIAIPSPSQSHADPKPVITPSSRAANPLVAAAPSALPQPTAGSDSAESQQSTVDIQQLVADLTAKSAESSSGNHDASSATPATTEAPASLSSLSSTALPSSSSLPPRPPLPQTASQSYVPHHHHAGSNPNIPAGVVVPPALGQSSYAVASAPGTSTETIGNLPHSPAVGLNAQDPNTPINAPPFVPNPSGYPTDRTQDADYQRQWDQFMADERQYMSEAKWDRFPEGSRIFIGNLSSDKVSKRDVFDIFHRFGRLAQISLKSAYGFVQYHAVDEGRRALENLQGMEVKGRRIHLEISRVQDKTKKERNRSPDRANRGRETGRRPDNNKYGRDENRSSRNHSPRRNEYYGGRNDNYGGERGGYYDSGRGRGRSRSPGYRRNDKDYRRRSPSPYGGRSRHDGELEIPRRYGADVPDVQIIMQPDVNRDFATWVESSLKNRGLKTEVMYLHPRIPKDQVIQRQAAEGVLAVVDLDLRSQNTGKIPVHAFDRSGGMHNVRFEQYIDLDPNTAAEVILRAKVPAAPNYGQAYGGNNTGYQSHQFGAQPQQHPHAAGFSAIQPGAYPPQPQLTNADIAGLMSRVDNATLQQILSTIQAAPPGMIPGAHAGLSQVGAKSASNNAQVDIQAILGSLNGNAASQSHASHPQAQYGGQYGAQHAAVQNGGANAGHTGTGDAAAQVQNIMAQLARYR